ncbi:arsenate reductase [Devosia subaequoris]|uniref:Arsenate reductase n=1 Tax=Devosia subaequoris TaxID=395930 RepID=A0A7W6IP75_9HYPH|nr:arsenate reductase (glutaredoxin) [Devosia subaequoris]MBB4052807.1 arsenate reductase [Devosia subaequoris]MCP1209958.1 arsenate reductase (glutaredoxin) [Devosia subaequoris]
MSVTIYHNPDCGTSRNTLAMIRGAGIEPQVILYREAPPSRQRLEELIARAGLKVRDAIRVKDTPYFELGLDNEGLSDEELIQAMLANPILINRPFVETEHGVRLCRPSEVVLDILPEALGIPFTKEDGGVVIDADGQRV